MILRFQNVASLFIVLCTVVPALFFLQQCRSKSGRHSSSEIVANRDDISRPADGIHAEYAKGFSVVTHPAFTEIDVFNPFQHHSDTLRYVLVPRDDEMPRNFKHAQVIRTPVHSMIVTSTTHLALTEMLHANDVIKAMVQAQYAYSPDIRRRNKNGEIKSFSREGFNNEVALNMHPELVMLSGGQASQYDKYRLLIQSGIAVFVNADWLETTPLGKAEWVKVMGLLLDKEKLAQKKFRKVAHRYNQLKKKVKTVDQKPLVINNLPYKGAWFVSGGDSFTARYFKDAGANYPWYGNHSTGGLKLSFETVFEAGLRADVWLNPGAARSKSNILAKDRRLGQFKSFKNDKVYNNNKRMSPGGGNDYWETGVVRPDLVLSDLIKILHPDVLPSDSLYFYRKVK